MQTENFDYALPPHQIASEPISPRDASKLLVYKNDTITHQHFGLLPEVLPENAVLVFNDTKVIPARLIFTKETGAKIELFCLQPLQPHTDMALAMQQPNQCTWLCMVGNAKRWKDETLRLEYQNQTITARKTATTPLGCEVQFEFSTCDFATALRVFGEMPLPPYLNRRPTPLDAQNYQTMYAAHSGAVAAPTAGLHFTQNVLQNLQNKGITQLYATLHVGAGTFKPLQPNTKLEDHVMHTEQICVELAFLQKLSQHIAQKKPVVAVGTTAMRTLESIYHLGIKAAKGENPTFLAQWQAYEQPTVSVTNALDSLMDYMQKNGLTQLVAHTQIMIVPGFVFNICSALVTNFHQPKSTLLCLVAAFVGTDWKKIYDEALSNQYRFLSYGDSSILFKKQAQNG